MSEVEQSKEKSKLACRLLLFPWPFQGHITPMFHLATLLYSKGFSITIIQTHYNSIDPTNYPNFSFHFIDDAFESPPLDPLALVRDLNKRSLEPFRDCLHRIIMNKDVVDQGGVSCLIADPFWMFAGDVANSFNLPKIALRTSSMYSFVVYENLPLLRQLGFFPRQDTKLEEPILQLPPLKHKDLPSEPFSKLAESLVKEIKNTQAVIGNTFEQLESTAIAKVSQSLLAPIFTIGPLQRHSLINASSLWTEDQSSLAWLDTQPPQSVLYVSFGSLASVSAADFLEIAWGLANSMQPFLWVIRTGLVQGIKEHGIFPDDYLERVSGRGLIVKWAPQQKVLGHPGVGGFWSHCGWNSILESICEGVPMICLPLISEQAINARQVTDNWRVGLRLDRGMERDQIQSAIRRLMVEDEGKGMRNRMEALKEKATLCLMDGGSSCRSLDNLTQYILSL